MLEVAEGKGVYKSLLRGDIGEIDSLYEGGAFDSAICVGTFTHGHLRPAVLSKIMKPLKKGGLLGFTVRQDLFLADAEFQEVIDTLKWDLVNRRELTVSGGSWGRVLVYSWVFKKI